ncbi:MAG: cytochrome c biogenesis protein CcsA [Phycisphaerales bacterium]|nr:cytochrome c biogenesis protein CcsA [Phycisphaerales bacterium]
MFPPRHGLIPMFWTITLLLLALAGGLLAVYAPTEATMGEVQKIFYLHLPVALNMFLACSVVFVGSVGYAWQRRPAWDDLAQAGAQVAVLLCSVTLITGMIWGRSAWGHWWTWSPRLTFSLMLWLLYVVYLMIRPSIESPQRRALVSAVYGMVAFVDVPLVYLSTKLLPDIHPSGVDLDPAMWVTLIAWSIPITMLTAGLIHARFALNGAVRGAATTEPPVIPTDHRPRMPEAHA